MNNQAKVALAVGLLILAGIVYIILAKPFRTAPGAGKTMLVICSGGEHKESMGLDKALSRGATFSGETGYTMACPKCGKLAYIRPTDTKDDPARARQATGAR